MPGAAGSGAPKSPEVRETPFLHTLLAFVLDMRRGMEEFRRAYGITGAGDESSVVTAEVLAQRIAVDPAARREVESIIQELKVHHVALLEGYNEATQAGSRRLLESLDPEKLRGEFEGGKVSVGPFQVSTRFRPVLVQAIWEEMLRRFKQYRALDAAQFERFYREGFQRGYRRFWDARRARPEG